MNSAANDRDPAEFNDPADWQSASHEPDIAAELDSPQKVLGWLLAQSARRWQGDLPRTHADFSACVEMLIAQATKQMEALDRIEAGELPAPETFREAAERFSFLFNRALIYITGAENPRLAAWAAAYALGARVCCGVSMTDRANELGVKKATMSKEAKWFCRANNLPPSQYMKDEEATGAYARVRAEQLAIA